MSSTRRQSHVNNNLSLSLYIYIYRERERETLLKQIISSKSGRVVECNRSDIRFGLYFFFFTILSPLSRLRKFEDGDRRVCFGLFPPFRRLPRGLMPLFFLGLIDKEDENQKYVQCAVEYEKSIPCTFCWDPKMPKHSQPRVLPSLKTRLI